MARAGDEGRSRCTRCDTLQGDGAGAGFVFVGGSGAHMPMTDETTAPAVTTADPDIVLPDANASLTPGPINGLESPQDFYTQQPSAPPPAPVRAFAPPVAAQPPPPAVHQSFPPARTGAYRTDDESVAQAQKHAKWAISALNFEDVNTAVKELRIALEALGAA